VRSIQSNEYEGAPRSLTDLAAAYLVVTWIIAVVEIPPIPISPTVHAPFLLVLAADGAMLRGWRRAKTQRVLWWLLGFLALRAGLEVASGPLEQANSLVAARIVAALVAVGGLAAYGASHPQRWRRLLAFALVTITASLLWFLLELGVGPPFVAWRIGMYTDIYGGQQMIALEVLRSGLAPFVHLLGYQIALLLPVAAVAAATAASVMRRLTAGVSLLITVLALGASLQRSALLASAIALSSVWFVAAVPRRRLAGTLVAVGLAASGVTALAVSQNDTLRLLAEASLMAKIRSEEARRDSDFRVRLQGRAVTVIAQHPLGLRVAGLDWGETGFMHVYRTSREVPSNYVVPFAAHNAYLSDGVSLGVGALLASLATAILLVVSAWRLLRAPLPPRIAGMARVVAGALIGLLTGQALTHNAGIPTAEPVTMVTCALLIAAATYQRVNRAAS
jgi:hypothetical protein